MISYVRKLAQKIRRLNPDYQRPVADYELRDRVRTLDQVAIEDLRTSLLSAARYQEPLRVVRHGYRVYSQSDEDGILAEIFRRVGMTNRFFVEFGVGDGLENNTLYRLAAGWTGVWIEGSPTYAATIRNVHKRLIATDRLRLIEGFITAETIERLFAEAGVPEEFDLLSIDIDGNDYWVWRSIERYRPRVVVVEYNSGIGPTLSWAMPYRPDYVPDGSRAFGASLKAFELLARAKGYSLVGCSINGVNAFFVRSDLVADRFLSPFDSETHFESPRYYLLPFPGHTPSHKEAEAIAAGPPPLPPAFIGGVDRQ